MAQPSVAVLLTSRVVAENPGCVIHLNLLDGPTVIGAADDPAVDFGEDEFNPNEGFTGTEDTPEPDRVRGDELI